MNANWPRQNQRTGRFANTTSTSPSGAGVIAGRRAKRYRECLFCLREGLAARAPAVVTIDRTAQTRICRDPGIRHHLSQVGDTHARDHADERLPVLLRLPRLRGVAAPQSRRLLRVLFLRQHSMSADPRGSGRPGLLRLMVQSRNNHRNTAAAARAPTICAPMKAGAEVGAMPAKVLLRARASVTAGLAKEVEAVNQ